MIPNDNQSSQGSGLFGETAVFRAELAKTQDEPGKPHFTRVREWGEKMIRTFQRETRASFICKKWVITMTVFVGCWVRIKWADIRTLGKH